MRLKSPLQSWGLVSHFDTRDTSGFPSKSGVVGLLCSALGIQRGDEVSIEELAGLKMSAIRTKDGILHTDFHTVGHKHTHSMHQLRTADGKAKQGAVTYRDYLVDAEFIVVLTGAASVIDRCSKALDNPKWSVHLGRRSCIPTLPVLETVLTSKDDVIKYLEKQGVTSEMFCQSDADSGAGQMDVPVNFESRVFTHRFVTDECVFIR